MKVFNPEQSAGDPEVCGRPAEWDLRKRFDLEHWISVFPFFPNKSGWHAVVGPSDVAIVEQIRRKAGGPATLGPSVPTDVFVLAKGEPKRRDVTKVGGLPYRPADLEWPERPDKVPFTFLAQFQFGGSRDLVGRLPGDVL